MPAFFIPNWFRVAGLKPRLLEHVRVERHRYGRQSWYALHDRLSGRVHRVTPAAFLFAARMDGQHTVDELWQALVHEMEADAPGQEAVVNLLIQLHGADLLAGDIPADAAELLSRRDRHARATLTRNIRSPMSLQVPLIDPDSLLNRLMPWVRPLLGGWGVALWLVLVIAGGLTASRHWAELSDNVADRVLATQGLLSLALCYPVMKILHELGHGLVAKRFGCEVREMGVMLLVLFPVPYVDASNSAALRSKWQRAAVAASGIAVELGLAAAAALVWAEAEPGVLRAVAFNVMLIGGVSTVLINGNPLLRFDGYYVLADLVGVPNLAQRGVRYLGYLVNRYAFGVPGLPRFPAGTYERAWMLLYSPVSWLYRMLMMASVALFISANYFALGVALAGVTLTTGLVWPLLKALGRVAGGAAYTGRRMRAAGLTFGSLALASLLLVALPVPVHTNALGVVWLPDEAVVRAGADGFVVQEEAAPGTRVQPGALLFTLQHPIAEARLLVDAAKVEELQAKVKAEWVTDRVAAGVTGFELAQEQATRDRERERLSHMTVLAGASGTFSPVHPQGDAPGRFVKTGEVMGWVTPEGGKVARVLVTQADIGLVQSRLRGVSLLLADQTTELSSAVLRAVPAAADDIPNAALAGGNGGSIATDVRDTKRLKALERHFQFDVSLPPGEVAAPFGSRVYVRFDFGWERLGDALYRRVRQALLSRFDT